MADTPPVCNFGWQAPDLVWCQQGLARTAYVEIGHIAEARAKTEALGGHILFAQHLADQTGGVIR